jgi:hypothetical protein
MTEPAAVEAEEAATDLSMAVVGYEITYDRTLVEILSEGRPEHAVQSVASIDLSLKGATVAHLHHRPIKTATLEFSAGPFDADRSGRLHDFGTGISIIVRLPWADFPAVWAALRLDRVADLICTIVPGTDKVVQFRVKSQGALGTLFGV